MRTEYGTILLSARTRYWASDWDGMYKFIKERDAFYLMERRITPARKRFSTITGLMPPGLNIDSQTAATVRAN